MKRYTSAPLVVSLLAPLASIASDQPMAEVVATAPAPSPSEGNSLWLEEQDLQDNRGQSLGELLENLPGISNASFGQGVARPVIRGLSGNRVQIFSNGTNSADLSAMSADHSPMVDLAASEAVELIRGPDSLRYHASPGGTINVLDQRIHQQEFDGWRADLGSGFATNGNARLAVARLDVGNGQSIMHLDGFRKEAGDYDAGQGQERSGHLPNSDIHSEGMAMGLSRIFDNGSYAGISVAHLEADYAIPNATDANVRVTPDQTRYDLQTGMPLMSGLWTYWRLQLARNDYRHEEWRADLAEGLFVQDFIQIRTELDYQTDSGSSGTLGADFNRRALQLCHDHSGCPAIPDYSSQSWDGSTGNDFSLYEGYLFAHDTPMPLTNSRDLALFGTYLRDMDDGQIELAGRLQPRSITANPDSIRSNYRQQCDYYRQRRYSPLSLALSWQQPATANSNLRAGLSRLQRAPVADELYWNGDHHATFSFQLDNPDLQIETAYTFDIGWQGHNTVQQWQLDAYFYDWRNYIYNRLQDFGDPYHGNHVYRHEQEDARMTGIDGQWQYQLTYLWQLQTRAAMVRGWLNNNGSPLPRLPADNLSLVLHRQLPRGYWWMGLDAWSDQNRTAYAETTTPGWYQLNLGWHHSLALTSGILHLDLEAKNLTNRYGRSHTSWLKDSAPVPGRNIRIQVRWDFEAG
jgi:iron complex outermembrane recepter protein